VARVISIVCLALIYRFRQQLVNYVTCQRRKQVKHDCNCL